MRHKKGETDPLEEIPLQTEVKYTGSSNLLAAWWPLFEGPADFQKQAFLLLVTYALFASSYTHNWHVNLGVSQKYDLITSSLPPLLESHLEFVAQEPAPNSWKTPTPPLRAMTSSAWCSPYNHHSFIYNH